MGFLSRVRDLDVAWFGAAAGAAAAGAALVPGRRVTAGLVAGAAVLALGAWRRGRVGGPVELVAAVERPVMAVDADAAPAPAELDWSALLRGSRVMAAPSGCASC